MNSSTESIPIDIKSSITLIANLIIAQVYSYACPQRIKIEQPSAEQLVLKVY